TVLGALVALDLGVLERRPIRLLLFEAADVFLHDLFDRNADELSRARMPCNAHGVSPLCQPESRRPPAAPSNGRITNSAYRMATACAIRNSLFACLERNPRRRHDPH